MNDPPDLEMRPIIAGPMCSTHRLSHLLDILLRPFVEVVRANVRNTRDMLARFPKRLEENHSLATLMLRTCMEISRNKPDYMQWVPGFENFPGKPRAFPMLLF